MKHTKPQVIIDLDEYNELKNKKNIEGLGISKDELMIAITQLIALSFQEPQLVRRPPAEGLILNTPAGKFNVQLTMVSEIGKDQLTVQSFNIRKLE